MPKKPTEGGRTLAEYILHKKRASCAVCALPDELRAQIGAAGDKKIRRTVVVEWLRDEQGVDISDEILTSHYSGKHERGAA